MATSDPQNAATHQGPQRVIGRRREYDEYACSYGPWTNITIAAAEIQKLIPLSRGGKLAFRPNVLSDIEQTTLTATMQNCKLFRQYSFGETYSEPRSHVLLSSKIKSNEKYSSDSPVQPGYIYHGICMKAFPLDQVPEVEQLANRLASLYGVTEWNTGVDMIAYKDGEDRMGWHADDTQGESLIVCVVISCPEPRPLHIRPKKSASRPLVTGDEQIEIYPTEGDAYDMDDVMQLNYEHSLPKKSKTLSHRFAIVFRNGQQGYVSEDSGQEVIKMSAPTHFSSSVRSQIQIPDDQDLDVISLMKKVRYKFQPVTFGPAECLEEGSCYDRRHLYTTFTHRSDQRGINGNKTIGSDSIVVSRQCADLREEDGLEWLFYTSTRKQGAMGLCRSHSDRCPVRVFRSSRLDNIYSPPPFLSDTGQQRTAYRYDGLYVVMKVFGPDGTMRELSPSGNEQYTFLLVRLPSAHECGIEHNYSNTLNIRDLCGKINRDRPEVDPMAMPLPVPISFDRLPTLPNPRIECKEEKVLMPSAKKHKRVSEHDYEKLPTSTKKWNPAWLSQQQPYELQQHFQSPSFISNRMRHELDAHANLRVEPQTLRPEIPVVVRSQRWRRQHHEARKFIPVFPHINNQLISNEMYVLNQSSQYLLNTANCNTISLLSLQQLQSTIPTVVHSRSSHHTYHRLNHYVDLRNQQDMCYDQQQQERRLNNNFVSAPRQSQTTSNHINHNAEKPVHNDAHQFTNSSSTKMKSRKEHRSKEDIQEENDMKLLTAMLRDDARKERREEKKSRAFNGNLKRDEKKLQAKLLRDHARTEKKTMREEEKRTTEKLIQEGRMAKTDMAALVKLLKADAMKYVVTLDAIDELKAHTSKFLNKNIRKEEYNQEEKDARLFVRLYSAISEKVEKKKKRKQAERLEIQLKEGDESHPVEVEPPLFKKITGKDLDLLRIRMSEQRKASKVSETPTSQPRKTAAKKHTQKPPQPKKAAAEKHVQKPPQGSDVVSETPTPQPRKTAPKRCAQESPIRPDELNKHEAMPTIRAITPRWEKNEERGILQLTPTLVALKAGRTRFHRCDEMKVTVVQHMTKK